MSQPAPSNEVSINRFGSIFVQVAGPVCVILAVASAAHFLIEVFYTGPLTGRLNWIFSCFSFAAVLISRISIEEGYERANLFGILLGIATLIATMQFMQGNLLIHAFILSFTWWMASRLTWDCTFIDRTRDATGQGMIDLAIDGVQKFRNRFQDPNASPTEQQNTEQAPTSEPRKDASSLKDLFFKRKQANSPGLWAFYFLLFGIPFFGLGQLFISMNNEAGNQAAVWYLLVYMTSLLCLLMLSSVLGLHRYLAQNRSSIPFRLAKKWMITGTVLAITIVGFCFLLPRPTARYSVGHWLPKLTSQNLSPSELAHGQDGQEKGNSNSSNSGPKARQDQQKQSQNNDGKQSSSGSSDQKESSDQGAKQDKSGGQSPDDDSGKSSKGKGKKSGQGDKSGKSKSQKESQQQSGDNQNSKQKSSQQKQNESQKKSNSPESEKQKSKSDKRKGPQAPSKKSQRKKEEPQKGSRSSRSRNNKQQQQQSQQNESQEKSQNERSQSKISLARLFKFILWLIIGLVVLYFAIKNRDRIGPWIRSFLAELADFWNRLWNRPKKERAHSEAIVEQPKPSRPQPKFTQYNNPFANGQASTWPAERLIKYTFEAVEAWGRDQHCPREPDQTALEFARKTESKFKKLASDLSHLANLYSELAYAGKDVNSPAAMTLAPLWEKLTMLYSPTTKEQVAT